jgi:glycosyltransferase involved in cell wall biosynthesis
LAVAGPTSLTGALHLGLLDAETLADAYAAANCVLAPSRYEGCSFVVLEALATGATLVSSRVGWIPELLEAVPAYRSLTAPPHDADAFIAATGAATSPIADASVAAATEYVRANCSVDTFLDRWERVLIGVVERFPDRVR